MNSSLSGDERCPWCLELGWPGESQHYREQRWREAVAKAETVEPACGEQF